jgi:hypothetical protein
MSSPAQKVVPAPVVLPRPIARLWQRQGKRDDARALLAPLYA